MNIEYYERLLDKNAREKMTQWSLQRMKQDHYIFLSVIYQTIEEASVEYRKLVTEMRQAQNDYFACRDTSKKKGLLARATDLERRVDKFKVDLPPAPSHTQKTMFE